MPVYLVDNGIFSLSIVSPILYCNLENGIAGKDRA